jgi:hypothetical protein
MSYSLYKPYRHRGFSGYKRRGKKPKYVEYRRCVTYSSEASLLSKGCRTVDEDILLLLYQIFRKGGSPLRQLKQSYRTRHGDKAADYLEEAWSKWMKGSTRVSVQTMNRLVDLVPRVITDGERYSLLKKLYDQSRAAHMTTHHVSIVLGRDERQGKLLLRKYADDLVAKPRGHNLPDHVKKRMNWVCNDDANLAMRLMAAVEEELSASISKAANLEVDRLLRLLRTSERIEGEHSIEFPYGTIVVSVRQKTLMEKLGDVFR